MAGTKTEAQDALKSSKFGRYWHSGEWPRESAKWCSLVGAGQMENAKMAPAKKRANKENKKEIEKKSEENKKMAPLVLAR